MTVEGYCGLFGSGKTYAMVIEAYNARKRNPDLPIMTNLGRLDLPGAPCRLIGQGEPLQEMMQALVDFHDGYLLLDEVGVFLPARLWSKMPAELCWKWAQLRKDAVELRWTCIRPANAVKDLRDITFETHWCTSWRRFGFFVVKHYSYTSVLDKRYFQSQKWMRFRKGLAGRLYDTLGKVKAPEFAGGPPALVRVDRETVLAGQDGRSQIDVAGGQEHIPVSTPLAGDGQHAETPSPLQGTGGPGDGESRD